MVGLSLRRTRCSPQPARCSPADETAAASLPPPACPPPTPLHTAAGGTLLHTAAASTGRSFLRCPLRLWSCRCRPNPTGGCPFCPCPSLSISWRCRRQEGNAPRCLFQDDGGSLAPLVFFRNLTTFWCTTIRGLTYRSLHGFVLAVKCFWPHNLFN
uniref:Uncharacterized protein n=1 Tax=Triticum urartu TaxID=4572 RepID=A0A8R7P703_TRIUA